MKLAVELFKAMSRDKSCRVGEFNLGGFQAIRLENEFVQADVLPELGGRLWNLLHKPTGRQWLWHNPCVALRTAAPGSSYDDQWAGGWEELFPNDAPGEFMGRNLPDHGEWWSRPWQWQVEDRTDEQVGVRLWRDGAVTRTRCVKRFILADHSSQLSVRYRIANLGAEPLYFLFKQHLAVAVDSDCRLDLPGGKVTPVDLSFSTRIGESGPFPWPTARGKAGETVDLTVLPPVQQAHREFVYVSELPEGWCGVRDLRTGASLKLRFSLRTFPYVWIFMTFGGWRNLYTVVLEPCTNMPKDLKQALGDGRCAVLSPKENLECDVRAVLSSGA